MKYLIRLNIGNSVYKYIANPEEKITFGNSAKDNCQVQELSPKQISMKISDKQLVVSAKDIDGFYKQKLSVNTGYALSKEIYVRWCEYTGISEQTYELPYEGVVTVGRKPNNTIVISEKHVSGTHITIICREGNVRIEDGNKGHRSTNGTYYNGKKIEIAAMKPGDFLDIFNIRIGLKQNTLYFENVGDALYINKTVPEKVSIKNIEKGKQLTYRRAPRMRKALPDKEIILAKAPAPRRMMQKRRGMLPSMISSGAMMASMFAMGGIMSPALIAARAAGMAAPVFSVGMSGGSTKKQKKEFEKAQKEFRERYGAYIENQYAVINKVADQQKRIITEENPEPEQWIKVLNELHPNLWERRPSDSDFLNVRVGMGYDPICVNVKAPSDSSAFQMEEDETQQIINQVIESTRIVDGVPARVNLYEYKTVGVVGRRSDVVGLIRNMVVSLTSAHYRDDVRIVGIFDKEEEHLWEAMRWIPHIWDENEQCRFLAFDRDAADGLTDSLFEIIHHRLSVKEDYDNRTPAPYYIFILGSYDYIKKSKLLGELVENSNRAGASTIFAYNLDKGDFQSSRYQMSFLPNQCQYVIDTEGDCGSPSAFEFQKQNKGFMFSLDKSIDDRAFDDFCRTMSAVNVVGGAGKMELPGGVTFLEGMGISNVKDLNIWERWNKEDRNQQLGASIGVMANGKDLSIDIGDFTQPPISLVAGMSGSGKSELLKTWILSLALNHSPEELEFVIIDYKGGSMAASVEGLPHVIGTLTDIEAGDIMRILDSLSYEITRRKILFNAAGVEEYKEYYKLNKKGVIKEPLPIMVIVCDEFAELKQQHKEFMTELVQIARVGRSLGVRLVLATQSPAGVVDQDLFDNSRFQICLKVQNAAASKSMIGRPDAARLTQNGRAYVRAGSDELFELVQSYWTGAPYFNNKEKKASVGNKVRIVNITGERIKTVWEEKTRFKSDTDELKAVIRAIRRIADEHGVKKGQCPWKPELPKLLNITNLGECGGFDGADWRPGMKWLKIPIGMFDIPEKQSQGIQYMDFSKEGHYGIYGLPGTGKKTMLKSIAIQLGRYYSPKDVNLFIIDLGSQTMRVFEKMPHVAGFALASEEDKIKKIADVIENIIVERRREFAKSGISNFNEYRSHISDDMPAVFLMIENLHPLFDVCPDFEKLIYRIGDEGAGYGIYLIYTAISTSGMRYKLTQVINSAIAFEMSDKSAYLDAIGKNVIPEKLFRIKGRGYFKGDFEPVVFQAAVYGEGETELEWQKWVKNNIELMNRYWDGPIVKAVKSMPDTVATSEMLSKYNQRDIIPVGVDFAEIQPAYLDFTKECGALIVGNKSDSRRNVMLKIAELISKSNHYQNLYVIDDSRKTLSELSESAEQYICSASSDEIDSLLIELITNLMEREKQLKELTEEREEKIENSIWIEGYPQICVMISDFGEFINLIDDDRVYKRMNGLVKNAHGLGLVFIAAGDGENITELSNINGVASRFVQFNNTLMVSGTIKSCGFLKATEISGGSIADELENGIGLLCTGKGRLKIKLIE